MSKTVAIVTGASQGIGRSTALRLSRDFSTLVLVARSLDKLDETARMAQANGAETLVLGLDLSQPEAAKTVVAKTLDRFGRIDTLVNIAGAVPQVDVLEMTDEQWDAGMALKLHGARRLTIEAWPALKTSRVLILAEI